MHATRPPIAQLKQTSIVLTGLSLLVALAGCEQSSKTDGQEPPGTGAPTCAAGQVACGMACVDVMSNIAHCGSCGAACARGQQCNGGICGCPLPLSDCAGACINLQGDGQNCGTCGNVCSGGSVCSAGTCQASCTVPGQTQCGASCVVLMTDASHCGACGAPCLGGTCAGGLCSCPAGQLLCEGACTEVTASDASCGACGVVCSGDTTCANGACVSTAAGGTGGGGTGGGGTGGTGGTTGGGGAVTGGAGTSGGGTGGAACTNVRPTGTEWDEATCNQWATQTSQCSAAWMIDNHYCDESCGRCTPGGGGTGGTTGGTGGGGTGGGGTGGGGTGGAGGSTGGSSWKPRVIHTTDLGADPDDEQSMVRALVMANEVDIEGLIVATGCWKKSQSSTSMLDRIVNAYGQAESNLRVHDPDFPTVGHLRSVSVLGQNGYGMGDVGSGQDSDGSRLIVAAVDSDDPRPVWATCWGGCNTIAQALWSVQNSRSAAELDEFVSRLRVYDILGQDNAGTWIAKTFPDLIYIRATQVYSWQPSDTWIDQNVQNHGPLGAVYPDRRYATEGDSPAIFHVLPNGLHDPDQIDHGGWGGLFTRKSGVRGMSCMSGEDARYDPYTMYNEATESISRWENAIHNDFQARMDWANTSNYGSANHHPIAVVNGDTGRGYVHLTAPSGSSVQLSAAGSRDPDGDGLTYKWWIYDAPSSGSGSIQNSSSETCTVSVSNGGDLHVVLEVIDNGSPNLTAYRRVIING